MHLLYRCACVQRTMHLGCAVLTVQVQIKCSVCAKLGRNFPAMSRLLCVHYRAVLRMPMHGHLAVQICSMVGPVATAMTRQPDVQKSHRLYRKEDFLGKLHPGVPLPFCHLLSFPALKVQTLPSQILSPPLKDSSGPWTLKDFSVQPLHLAPAHKSMIRMISCLQKHLSNLISTKFLPAP